MKPNVKETAPIRLIINVTDLEDWQLADELGFLRSAMQPLKSLEERIEDELKMRNPCTDTTGKQTIEIIGQYYRALIIHSKGTSTAWKAIAQALAKKFNTTISGQLKGAHTQHPPKTSLKLNAMKKEL